MFVPTNHYGHGCSKCELVIAQNSPFQESMLECVFGLCTCPTELLAVQKEYEEALSLLRTEAEGRHQHEIESLKSQYEEDMDKMKASLSDKTTKLLGIQTELENMKSMVAEKEEALGSATLVMQGVRQQLTIFQVELEKTKQEKDKLHSEIEHLKVSHFVLGL